MVIQYANEKSEREKMKLVICERIIYKRMVVLWNCKISTVVLACAVSSSFQSDEFESLEFRLTLSRISWLALRAPSVPVHPRLASQLTKRGVTAAVKPIRTGKKRVLCTV